MSPSRFSYWKRLLLKKKRRILNKAKPYLSLFYGFVFFLSIATFLLVTSLFLPSSEPVQDEAAKLQQFILEEKEKLKGQRGEGELHYYKNLVRPSIEDNKAKRRQQFTKEREVEKSFYKYENTSSENDYKRSYRAQESFPVYDPKNPEDQVGQRFLATQEETKRKQREKKKLIKELREYSKKSGQKIILED